MKVRSIRWWIDGLRMNRKLDRLNTELAIQDALEFEQAVKASHEYMKQQQRELKQMDKVLRRAVKAL
jgi:hypothetical protein